MTAEDWTKAAEHAQRVGAGHLRSLEGYECEVAAAMLRTILYEFRLRAELSR